MILWGYIPVDQEQILGQYCITSSCKFCLLSCCFQAIPILKYRLYNVILSPDRVNVFFVLCSYVLLFRYNKHDSSDCSRYIPLATKALYFQSQRQTNLVQAHLQIRIVKLSIFKFSMWRLFISFANTDDQSRLIQYNKSIFSKPPMDGGFQHNW